MYTEQEARKVIIEAGLKLVEEKLIARTWGNISARISKDEFVITPSGRSYDSLSPEDLVVVRIDDLSYSGDIKPSSEKGAHAIAYKLRKDVDFIIHTHQFYASVLAADCRTTWVAPCAKYALPGTKKLIKNIGAIIKRYPDDKVFLMARHGTLILGSTMGDTFERASRLEEDAKKMFVTCVPELADVDPDSYEGANFNTAKLKLKNLKYVSVLKDPYVMKCCESGKKLKPYIDDFAMIAGPDVACVDNKTARIKRAFLGRNAVLVKGIGAICAGNTEDDLEAVEMIVSKNAAAACYVKEAKPLSRTDARMQRYVYQTKYSKRKDGDIRDAK